MAEAAYWALTDPFFCSAASLPSLVPPEFILSPVKRHTLSSAPVAAASAEVLAPVSSPLNTVPIVDLSQLHDDSFSPELHRACTEWGLFQLVNHGVPHAVMQEMGSQIDLFLDLPIVERCPCPVGNLGEGYGTGFFRSASGVNEWRDYLRLFTYPLARRDYSVWPTSSHFRQAIEDYADEVRALQLRVLGHLLLNLGLRASQLEEIVGEIQQLFLVNHYPPCPQPELVAGIDEHTDVGTITCLWQQNDVMGLQVFYNGEWIPVKPVPGALIIVLGDMIQIATNGVYKSGLHRGLVNATKHRVSVASFYQLTPEHVVAPAAELVNDQRPCVYQATNFSYYRRSRHHK